MRNANYQRHSSNITRAPDESGVTFGAATQRLEIGGRRAYIAMLKSETVIPRS